MLSHTHTLVMIYLLSGYFTVRCCTTVAASNKYAHRYCSSTGKRSNLCISGQVMVKAPEHYCVEFYATVCSK